MHCLLTLENIDSVAESLLEAAGPLRCLAFYGPMGAGKTTLVQALCKRLGVQGPVTSPTFGLVKEYLDKGQQPVYHFDFYRIDHESEAQDIGAEEYFYSGRLCCIEWPEKIPNLLPDAHLRITIEMEGQVRTITANTNG